MIQIIKNFFESHIFFKKIAGVILIAIGLIALITPLTPGAWLALIGFELLGIRILFLDKFKFWNKDKNSTQRQEE